VKLTVPELSLVVLIGPSGSGKSTFAARHFLATGILSSDSCRGLVSDDENAQDATKDAFDVLHYIAGKRLARGLLTVVDATNVQQSARKPLIALAREHHVLPVAIVLDFPEMVCQERNQLRPDRAFGPHVVRNQIAQLRRSFRGLKKEGFRYVHVLKSQEDVDGAEVVLQPLWNNLKHERGPFDIIGDVHGCFAELTELLTRLGYEVDDAANGVVRPPPGRKAVFLGDLVDRGPATPAVLRLVMGMVRDGVALCVPGNHDVKLVKALRGKNVQLTHGLDRSMEQLASEPEAFRDSTAGFLDGLVSHYVLDDGRLVVAHAGMKEAFQGRGSGRVRDFALYGDTTGETDEFGLPVRQDWAREYRGRSMVVYGHTPVPSAEWLNNTINVDTGCVFGGALTALRYPERDLVSVTAKETYAVPVRPLAGLEPGGPSAQQRADELLDLEDVVGKRIVQTRLRGRITVREENAIAALEVMSRWAVDPRWLVYLPPTMSPSKTTRRSGMLEHPDEAFSYYRHEGVAEVVCEEKHMGSRAVVVVCRDADVARRRFGVTGDETGVVHTRTGRPFFSDPERAAAVLDRSRAALDASGFWELLETDWVVLDAEVMPWSAKAGELLRNQYGAVGAAARTGLAAAVDALERVGARGHGEELLRRYQARAELAVMFAEAYRPYCWEVAGVEDLRVAPFHVLATEGRTHSEKDHVWHMQTLGVACAADPQFLVSTPYRVVGITDPASQEEATSWWNNLTERGGEGMVVKPRDFIARGRRGLVQPAVKVRGKEYLRIIYGPEYTEERNLDRLRSRGLSTKRSLALREFAVGLEGLDRFVRGEPLRRVHECVFAVLALESEPVDPRL
jgi:protein phosphatase